MTRRIAWWHSLLAPCCALVLLAGPARAEDWWGRPLAALPTNFIFGYGSLIQTASRDSSVGKPMPAIPVRVSAAFGYIRTWNDRAPSGFTALGMRRAAPGEAGWTINGVLYPVEGADMSVYDQREAGYARVEVPWQDIQAVGWQQLPTRGHVWVYVPEPAAHPAPPDAQYPLLQSYVDVVIEGGLEYGEDYAREIIATTQGWSRYWLNDRELARRPWVHDPAYGRVDALLRATPPAADALSARLLPEAFAARWLLVPAQ